MILEKHDAEYIAKRFVDYMSNYGRIDDHMRMKKLERLKTLPHSLPGFEPENNLFSDFNMHPEDMDLEIYEPSPSEFSTMVEITSSFCNVELRHVVTKCISQSFERISLIHSLFQYRFI